MKKVVVAMTILASIVANTVSASSLPGSKEVSICVVDKHNLLALAKEKILCSGDYEGKTNILKMYKNDWEIKTSFLFKDRTYLVFERTKN
ncbi:hypothetical protein [Nitrosophilus labii]|uniref:hypothetical protein n=1 Tax=Nitrosophilus labii TaxID=2706014 RepID=UPI001656AECC|nr:hypothetical protein [Nitrosophilus labii]